MLDHLDLLPPSPRSTGRAPRALTVEYVRDLTAADIALLASERGIKSPQIIELRERHHALARCLASGLKPAEASAVTGYCISRISILKSDPTFRELVSFYTEKRDAAFSSFQERAAQVSVEALNIISERMEDDRDQVTLGQALEITKTLADRTGHAPVTKTQNFNVNVNMGDKLRAARERMENLLNVTPAPPLLEGS